MLSRLISIFALVSVIGLCFAAIISGNMAHVYMIGVLPLLLIGLGRPGLIFIAIYWAYGSTLRIPGLTGQLQLYHALMALFIVVAVQHALMTGKGLHLKATHWWGILFVCVLLAVMFLRGTGFRVTGSGHWGGARYVEMLLGMGLFLTAGTVQLSDRERKYLIAGMIFSGILPVFGELVYMFSGGAISWQYIVLAPEGAGQALEVMQDDGLTRFKSLSSLAPIYLLPFVFSNKLGRLRPIHFLFLGLGFFFGGFTGHRIVLLHMLLFVWTYMFLLTKRKIVFVLWSFISGGVFLFLLGQVAFILPLNFQRMLSLIPFADVSSEVTIDAFSTVDWRIILWKRSLPLIPEYFWIGKGYAYSPDLALASDVRWFADYAIWWALVQSAYHQGILSLLIGMGIFGLLSGSAFLVGICLRNYRFVKESADDTFLQNFHYALFVLLLVRVFSYFIIYGDAFVSFPGICMYAALTEVRRKSHESRHKRLVKDDLSLALQGPGGN